ncbi:MAG: ribosome biogenesis GTP-binding protein YihA/YsxC [Thiohalospira sp.]
MTQPPQPLHFVVSAHRLNQLPPDEGREVVVAGRSNAGKSSALNRLTGRRDIARVSKAPGRTQQINIFAWDPGRRLADLPGYGYARVPDRLRAHWGETLGRYLAKRESLAGLVLVMDIRRDLADEERQLLDWAADAGLPALVLLNKADKLGRGQQGRARSAMERALAERPGTMALPFSATHGQGVEAAQATVGEWLDLDLDRAPGG